MPVDNRSPEQAYTTKDNIVVPSASEYGATSAHLAERTVSTAADKACASTEPQPTTRSRAAGVITETRLTKGRG